MSLDVYLKGPEKTVDCYCPCCDNKHQKTGAENIYSRNITHNLGRMADEAGLYYPLWMPEEINITKAEQLIPLLEKGLMELLKDPKKYQELNPENGWGSYDGLVDFTESYLAACRENPNAIIEISR